MKFISSCPCGAGRIEREIPDEDMMEALYPLFLARLQEEFVLTPKE
jgi:hypothetical protein